MLTEGPHSNDHEIWLALWQGVLLIGLMVHTVKKNGEFFPELVASFTSCGNCSHGLRWKATGSYEGGAVRKMRGVSSQNVARNAPDRHFFGPHCLDVQISQFFIFSHYFKRLERFANLVTSS